MADSAEYPDNNHSDYGYPDYNDSDLYSDYFQGNFASVCEHQRNLSVVLVLAPYVQSVICALGVLGNALVILAYCCARRPRSLTETLLLNVAAADLLLALTLPLLVYSRLWAWPLGAAGCKVLRGAYSVNLYGGMALLACVSVDRYVAIVQARRSFRLRSAAYGRWVGGAVWSGAALLSVPTFVFYDWYQPQHLAGGGGVTESAWRVAEAEHVCEFRFRDEKMATAMKVAVPGTQLAVGFFLPLAVMTFCYGAVVATLAHAKNSQRHKAVRVVLLVVAAFVACNLPYNVALLHETLGLFRQRRCDDADALQTALSATQTVAYLRCCLNPLLYAFVGVKFRGHLRRMLRDLSRRGRGGGGGAARRHSSQATSGSFLSSARRSVDSAADAPSFTM